MSKKGKIPWNKGKKDTRKYIYYTDGKINLRVLEGTPCPEGFRRGRIKRELAEAELIAAKEKSKQTCLLKYGVEYAFQADVVKEKIKETCIDKYGVEYAAQSEEVKQQIKAANFEKFGCENPNKCETVKEKRKQTCLDRYGVDNYAKTAECQEKIKETCLEKYGVENVRNAEFVIADAKKHSAERTNKRISSMRDHKTFNTSSPEENYYEQLIEKYGEDNVLRQYSDERYPFSCDFYIKPLDQFIELNLHWTHGGHAYDENNPEDQAKLTAWQEKASKSKYYKIAITTWTVRDVAKLSTAQKNNLNYVILYTLK